MNMKRNTAFFMAIFYFLSPVIGVQAAKTGSEVMSTIQVTAEGSSSTKTVKSPKVTKKKGVFKKFSKKHLLLLFLLFIIVIIGAGVIYKKRTK